MKKLSLSLRLIVFTSLLFTPWCLQAQTNYLRNPGFESSSNGSPDYWMTYPGAREDQTDPRIESIKEDAAEGKSFLRMSKRGGKVPLDLVQAINASDKAAEEIVKGTDKTLIFKGKIRGEGLSGKEDGLVIQIFAKQADGKGHFVGRLIDKGTRPSTEWQTTEIRVRLSDVLPSGETLAYLDIMTQVSSNVGHVDFDDLSLTLEE